MLTEAPAREQRVEFGRDVRGGVVVWWCAPQLSNQPSQNSEHISGPVRLVLRAAWRAARRRASRTTPVVCSPGRLPSASI